MRLHRFGGPEARDRDGLSDKFGITTTYDSNNEIHEVEVDVTSAPGEGIIVIDDAVGTYDDLADFYDAVSEVLGITVAMTVESSGGTDFVVFPTIKVTQTGTTVRLYEDGNGEVDWAPVNYRSVLWDALADKDGKITIDGEIYDLGGWQDPTLGGNNCPGVDVDSYDTDDIPGLDAEQCSSRGGEITSIGPGGTSTNPNCGVTGLKNCIFGLPVVKTLAESGTDLSLQNEQRFECEQVDSEFDTLDGLVCKRTEGIFWRTREQIAETLDMDADYFQTTNPTTVAESVSVPQESDETEIMSEMSDMIGTCAEAKLVKNGNTATTNTREGEYISSGNLYCDSVD